MNVHDETKDKKDLKRKQIRILLVLNLFIMATFNMAHPVTPKLINENGFPSYMFGVFFALMAVANYIMSPIWGSLSDQKGRKRFLILGVIGYGLSQWGFGLSSHIFPIVIFRLVGGTFSICYITAALAYLTDLTEPKVRMKYLSYYTATLSLGTSMGSLLGGVLGQNHYQYTFLAQGAFCMVLAIILIPTIRYMASQKEKGKKVVVYMEHLKPRKASIDFKSAIGILIVVMALINITTTAYNSTINYYIESILNMPSTVNGLVLAVAGVIGLIMNVFVGPWLSTRVEEGRLIHYTTGLTGIFLIAASTFNAMAGVLICLVGFVMASALVIPIQQSMVSKLADKDYGTVMGVQGSAKALGMVIGSLGSGFIFGIGPKLPFVFAGLAALMACILLKGLVLKKK
ncbi:MAG: MFS transporter [Niameybacter sp.]